MALSSNENVVQDQSTQIPVDNNTVGERQKRPRQVSEEVSPQAQCQPPTSDPDASRRNIDNDLAHLQRQQIQTKLADLSSEKLQQILEITEANHIQLERYRRTGSPLVQSRLDGLVLALLLIVGLISDYFAKDQNSFYLKLAIAIVVAVNQIDNCARVFAIETVCGSLLALDMIYNIIHNGFRDNIDGVPFHEDVKLLYTVLVFPMMNKNISWGTSLVCLIYLCFNLFMAAFDVAILVLIVVFLYQKGGFKVSQENYDRLYMFTGGVVVVIVFGWMYLAPKKFGAKSS